EKQIYMRNSKMSNLEISQLSNTGITQGDSNPNSPVEPTVYIPLNNYDTIRSYGSAADELENITSYSRDFAASISKGNNKLPTSHKDIRSQIGNSISASHTATHGTATDSQGYMSLTKNSANFYKPWTE
ncbi:unnamed protein product, partial [Meganyctiphanes norvegica]